MSGRGHFDQAQDRAIAPRGVRSAAGPAVRISHARCLRARTALRSNATSWSPDGEVPEDAVWIDLVNPAPGEDKLIERRLGIAVPTREEMQEIEVSSRLYTEHHARFMTATLMCNSDTVVPKTTAVTFILAKHRLVTVRYDEPKPFMLVSNKLTRTCPQDATGETVLMELLDAVIDREADLLERIGIDVDQVSHDIFDPHGRGPEQGSAYIDTLKVIGIKGDLTSKVRESLVSLGRLLLFLANEAEGMRWLKDVRLQLRLDAARRAVAVRPRHLSRQQDHLPARRAARRRHARAEQRHQDLLDRRGGAAAADAGRHRLRHELQEHAGAGLAVRLSAGARR